MMHHKDLALVPYSLLFINNMPITTFKNDKLVLYANDTSLVITGLILLNFLHK
jgi:hypothetical protein